MNADANVLHGEGCQCVLCVGSIEDPASRAAHVSWQHNRQVIERIRALVPQAPPLDDALVATLERGLKTWRCFHCGFETADPAEAEAHFGERDDAREFTPICTWWAKLTAEERAGEFQGVLRELNAEREESARLRTANEGLQYRVDGFETEIGQYFKGCRSATEAWHQMDSMTGRALSAEKLLEFYVSEVARGRCLVRNSLDNAWFWTAPNHRRSATYDTFQAAICAAYEQSKAGAV